MSGEMAKYSAEETARRGDDFYERTIRARLEPAQNGKVVAIDVETGAYTVADTALAAANQLRVDHPDAEVWVLRVGQRVLHRIGMQFRPKR